MKSFKFLSILLTIIVITGLILVGCEKSEDKNLPSSHADSAVTSTIVQESSQEETQKTESLNSNTESKKSKAEDGKAAIEKKLKETITEENLRAMKWSPDGKTLIYATGDNPENRCVYLWSVGEAEPHKANIETGWGTAFGWSPNSEYVLVEGGTSAIRSITIIDKTGEPAHKEEDKIVSFQTSGFAHPNIELEQFWSSDSAEIVIAQYNDAITALPDVEVSGVFDIMVYNVKEKATKTLLKSTASEYYTIDKWLDNNTIRCNKYSPKNNELGNVVETKDIKIS